MARVLRNKKFAWPEGRIDKTLRQLSDFTERVQPTKTFDVITVVPSDNRILECADAGKVDYIVSGDDHRLRLKQHGNAPIVKVAAFLKRLESGETQR